MKKKKISFAMFHMYFLKPFSNLDHKSDNNTDNKIDNNDT